MPEGQPQTERTEPNTTRYVVSCDHNPPAGLTNWGATAERRSKAWLCIVGQAVVRRCGVDYVLWSEPASTFELHKNIGSGGKHGTSISGPQ